MSRKRADDDAPRPFKRAGLHRLECACGNYAYATVAACETHGRPWCGSCQAPMMPVELELCAILEVRDAPVVLEAEQAMAAAIDRAATRAHRGDGRATHMAARCGSCHKFKSRPSDTCGWCGDNPVRVGQDPREFDREHGWDWQGGDPATDVDVAAVQARVAAELERARRKRARATRIGALAPAPEPMPF